MKQLLILSGKGGTGKTTIASSFIKLSNARAYADCDVDAPNLHLIRTQSIKPLEANYYGLPKAVIDTNLCTNCGICIKHCKFHAIEKKGNYIVDLFSCEGCGLCEKLCPSSAVSLREVPSGKVMLFKDEEIFSTSKLYVGSGTSGKLVTEVKKNLFNEARNKNIELAIIDGSPGIGCPVIASLSGVDMVLIVAEPSISGINDMKRIIETANKFQVKTCLCINKFDISLENSKLIRDYCEEEQIDFVGQIPFDKVAIDAINEGKAVVDIDCNASVSIKKVFNSTMNLVLN